MYLYIWYLTWVSKRPCKMNLTKKDFSLPWPLCLPNLFFTQLPYFQNSTTIHTATHAQIHTTGPLVSRGPPTHTHTAWTYIIPSANPGGSTAGRDLESICFSISTASPSSKLSCSLVWTATRAPNWSPCLDPSPSLIHSPERQCKTKSVQPNPFRIKSVLPTRPCKVWSLPASLISPPIGH